MSVNTHVAQFTRSFTHPSQRRRSLMECIAWWWCMGHLLSAPPPLWILCQLFCLGTLKVVANQTFGVDALVCALSRWRECGCCGGSAGASAGGGLAAGTALKARDMKGYDSTITNARTCTRPMRRCGTCSRLGRLFLLAVLCRTRRICEAHGNSVQWQLPSAPCTP